MPGYVLRWTLIVGLIPTACAAAEQTAGAWPKVPEYRIEINGFDARQEDVRAILDSAAAELWRYFPDAKIEPFVITRGRHGPITLFKRNDRHEIVVQLDTHGTVWSQYSYQFSHEFCHILCNFRADAPGNKWFEETLCETASLFVMRAMAKTWQEHPPFSNWKSYHDSLRQYTDDVLLKRDLFDLIARDGLEAFYRANQNALRKDACLQEVNGAMSLVLLRLLERQPEHWEAIRGLNSASSTADQPLDEYFRRWRDAAAEKHRLFIEHVGQLYKVKM